MEAMPGGLPQTNDRGLDRTHTHARTYWGGALYCLIADVRIREQTNGRYGLQDALRAIRRSGAGMSAEWPIERILTTGDAATGTTVLRDLYMTMRNQPVAPDLGRLWTELGIRMRDGMVCFDDSARLAFVRRAITRSPSSNGSQTP
jgi:predicted metalloprotease with PDZ domain